MKKQEVKTIVKAEKIDLACGQTKQVGFFGIDYKQVDGVDAVMDLESFPWNIESECADELFCSHYIEHTPDLIKFMEECYRILKKGGKMMVIAPYYSSIRCWQDPTHKRAISEATFLYYNKGWRDANKLDHYNITCDFDFTYGFNIDPYWQNKSQESRDFAIRHYNNVVSDIQVVLTKK